jgi:hypothetical protein
MSIQVTIRYQAPAGFALSKASIVSGVRAAFRVAALAVMFLATTVGGLQIGYGIWSYSTIHRAAYLATRYAEIHGAQAAASSIDRVLLNREIEQIVRRNSGDLRPDALTISTTWPDKNASDQKVRVRVAYSLRFFTGSLTLTSEDARVMAPQYQIVMTD